MVLVDAVVVINVDVDGNAMVVLVVVDAICCCGRC